MGLAACSCGDQGRGTTLVIPAAPHSEVEDAGQLQPSMNENFCKLATDYLEDHKSCEIDADCVSLTYRPTCCANARVVGVSQVSFDELHACVDKTVPVCACEATPDRAEDGRAVLSGVTVVVRCDAGRCVSGVTERTCGNKLVCSPDEVCVSYGDAQSDAPPDAGDANAYVAFACLPNPCASSLDCGCAMSVCDARSPGKRKCEIARNDESDVACVPYRD